jgi:hypothetical protein
VHLCLAGNVSAPSSIQWNILIPYAPVMVLVALALAAGLYLLVYRDYFWVRPAASAAGAAPEQVALAAVERKAGRAIHHLR